MRKSLTVAAIIPCYNGEAFLARAIASVHAQTRAVTEVIVVDDCSTDGSAGIAKRCGATLVRHALNKGNGAARNTGLRTATAELIAWLDADDLWEPYHVEKVAGLLDQHQNAAVAFGATRRFGSQTGVITGYVPEGPPARVFWEAFDDWLHTTIGSVVRREVLEQLGGFAENERYSVDYDLWLRIARRHCFVATHEVTNNWRCHPNQMSTSRDRQIRAVYSFRRQLWRALRDEGDGDLAGRVAARARELLTAELHRARFAGDPERLRFFASLIPLVPCYPRRWRLKWAARARSLAPLAMRDVAKKTP